MRLTHLAATLLLAALLGCTATAGPTVTTGAPAAASPKASPGHSTAPTSAGPSTASPAASSSPTMSPSPASAASAPPVVEARPSAPASPSAFCVAAFDRYNVDKDTFLSYDELVAGKWGDLRFAVAPTAQQEADMKAGFRTEAEKADADKDGKLTRAEYASTCS